MKRDLNLEKRLFFVVGAQKAGTTTLHEWLSQSTEVALPWTKETHFFRDEDKFSNGLDWYMGQFKSIDAHTRVIGEVDPEYMYFPECAGRISSVVRAPKLIIILREPLSRARSHYQMSVRRGYESLSFADALVAEKERLKSGGRFSQIHHSYLDRSLYGAQLERMMSCFDESEILVLLFDEIFSSQDSADRALSRVCDFIGINRKGISVDVSSRENGAAEPRFVFVRNFIYGKNPIKNLARRLIPSRDVKIKIMKFLDRINNKPLSDQKKHSDRIECPDFVYQRLIEDLRRVEEFTSVDVSRWIETYEKRLEK